MKLTHNTWLILEVEDGHDVIGKIKHRKHPHFGEGLGNFAQIERCEHFHVAFSITTQSSLCCFGVYFLIQLRRVYRETPHRPVLTPRCVSPPKRLRHSSRPINTAAHVPLAAHSSIALCCQLLVSVSAAASRKTRQTKGSRQRASVSFINTALRTRSRCEASRHCSRSTKTTRLRRKYSTTVHFYSSTLIRNSDIWRYRCLHLFRLCRPLMSQESL